MIELGNISTLIPASKAVSVADAASSKQELDAVARAINLNANCDETRTVWVGHLSDTTISTLVSNGYTVNPMLDFYKDEIPNMYIITSR